MAAVAVANPKAKIVIDSNFRPIFKFGDAKTAMALYGVSIQLSWCVSHTFALDSPGVPVLWAMPEMKAIELSLNMLTWGRFDWELSETFVD